MTQTHVICHGSWVCPCQIWPAQEGTQHWYPPHSDRPLHPSFSQSWTTVLNGSFEALEGKGHCEWHRDDSDARCLHIYFFICQA